MKSCICKSFLVSGLGCLRNNSKPARLLLGDQREVHTMTEIASRYFDLCSEYCPALRRAASALDAAGVKCDMFQWRWCGHRLHGYDILLPSQRPSVISWFSFKHNLNPLEHALTTTTTMDDSCRRTLSSFLPQLWRRIEFSQRSCSTSSPVTTWMGIVVCRWLMAKIHHTSFPAASP